MTGRHPRDAALGEPETKFSTPTIAMVSGPSVQPTAPDPDPAGSSDPRFDTPCVSSDPQNQSAEFRLGLPLSDAFAPSQTGRAPPQLTLFVGFRAGIGLIQINAGVTLRGIALRIVLGF